MRPAKSHSARSFFKLLPKDRQSPHRFNTIHTEPIDPTSAFKVINEKADTRSYRQFSTRVKELSFHGPEELHDQNQKLKGKVNRLTEELVRERVKRTQDTRHYLKMQRQVEVQFQDDKYLDLSRNQNKMIEGVKHQYQKMKMKFEDKCTEYNTLLKRYEISGGEESRFQCEVLRVENSKLRSKLEILLETQERIVEEYEAIRQRESKGNGGGISSRSKQKKQEVVLDLLGYSSRMVGMEKIIEDLKQRNAILSARSSNLKAILSERNQKIKFLDKLIIEKSNENHQLVMQDRKLQRQNRNLTSTLEEISYRLSKQNQVHREQMELLKQKQRIKFETEKCIFINSLKEKDSEIDKLSSELKYVTTLISYIKTGDDFIPENFNPLSKKMSNKERSQEMLMNLEKSLISFDGQGVRERVKSFFQSGRREPTQDRVQSNTETLKKTVLKSQGQDIGISESGSDAEGNQEAILESRMVKKSYLKHSKDCLRMKHVKVEQLEPFRLELVYRLIYYKITPSAAKDYLTFRAEQTEGLSRRQQRWRSRYLSLKQAHSKLQLYPFELKPQQANLFSRYLVEDATKEDLFYHEDNEIERSIAKSILKAFVGQYLIPDEKLVREEIREALGKSGKNLRSALTSLAPTGTITHFKFLEISTGINVDFSEPAQNYIISQLAAKSPGGISALLYDKLFDSPELF